MKEIKVVYFGQIAELLQKNEEVVAVDEKKIEDLRRWIENSYPQLVGIKFQIAVDKKITNEILDSDQVSEITLLPPFAGG